MNLQTDLRFSNEQVERMSMSIRPSSSGLAFRIYNDLNFEDERIASFLPLSRGNTSWEERQQELFFEYEFLSYPFSAVRLDYEAESFVLMPQEIYQESFSDLWRPYLNKKKELVTIVSDVPNERKLLIAYLSKNLLLFYQRIHLNLIRSFYLDNICDASRLLTRQKGNKELNLSLRKNQLDCFLFDQGRLMYANTLPISSSSQKEVLLGELMYYIFLLVKELKLNLSVDQLNCYLSSAEGEEYSSLYLSLSEALRDELAPRYFNCLIQML